MINEEQNVLFLLVEQDSQSQFDILNGKFTTLYGRTNNTFEVTREKTLTRHRSKGSERELENSRNYKERKLVQHFAAHQQQA
jgi:hypothetical protein